MGQLTKRSLLIINKIQFGYHIDSLKYCEYLKNDFEVTYLCFDTKKEKVIIQGVEVKYISWEGSFLKKGYAFIKACKAEIEAKKYFKVFCVYFQGVSLLINRINKQRMILDIRTGYIGEKSLKKWIYNNGIKFESSFFNQNTVISESLAKLLKLSNYAILPLGADFLSKTDKDFNLIKLIYVGTLTGRKIHETVEGCKQFAKETGINFSYDIFGSGSSYDVEKLENTIGITKEIRFHGFKHHSEIQKYYDECTIGVSYIPITAYFDVQPPTKTFEYINSGMICLATSTSENKKIISTKNGVLCLDNPSSFADSLKYIVDHKSQFSSAIIRSTTAGSNWRNIIENYLIPILNK